mgnify:CR=1 FL=1
MRLPKTEHSAAPAAMTTEEKELIEMIRNAFACVRLEDGVSLNMTEYFDSSGCMPELKERASCDERDDWQAIPDETLERFLVTFSFTDLKGYRFYIPAYMIWVIRNQATSSSALVDFTIFAIDPSHHLFETTPFLKWFSSSQVAAMMAFLEYMNDDFARENLSKIRDTQKSGSSSPG